jgi:hypothetical protein
MHLLCLRSWVLSTSYAVVVIAVRRDVTAHSRAMLLSAFFTAMPILQRLFNFFAAPLAIAIRCFVCLLRWDLPPWEARFGPPGSPHSLMMDPPLGHDTEQARKGIVDPRASPRAFSLDGYGEAEQAVFGVSAWLALAYVALCFGYAVFLSSRGEEFLFGPDDSALRSAQALQPLRAVTVKRAAEYAKAKATIEAWLLSRLTRRQRAGAGGQGEPAGRLNRCVLTSMLANCVMVLGVVSGIVAFLSGFSMVMSAASFGFATFFYATGSLVVVPAWLLSRAFF